MDKIRVSNIRQLAGVPYRLLSLDQRFSYEEGSPTENATKLMRGAVDVALIPAFNFLQSGCYESLGFGMGCRSRSQSMVLYSYRPLDEVRRIHLYQCSCSSEALLRLMLRTKWRANPEFIRESRLELSELPSDRDAMLMLHERPATRFCNFPFSYDLATLWQEDTKLPFVFLIWAARPGTITAEQAALLHDEMFKANKVSGVMAASLAPEFGVDPEQASVFVGDDRRYQLDDFLLAGLEEFIIRSQRQQSLKHVSYKIMKHRLFRDQLNNLKECPIQIASSNMTRACRS